MPNSSYPESFTFKDDEGNPTTPVTKKFTDDQRVVDDRLSAGIDTMNLKLDRVIELLEQIID